MTIKSIVFAGICLSCPITHATILTNPSISPDDISHWASTVVSFSPGPQDINVVGSPAASQGLPTDALGPRNNGTVSLGDGGSITLGFDSPFSNIEGADFAVFENAFGFNGLLFAELGIVSVSSNGTDFATVTWRNCRQFGTDKRVTVQAQLRPTALGVSGITIVFADTANFDPSKSW